MIDPSVYVAAALAPEGPTRAFLERWDQRQEFDVLWSQKLAYELHQTLYDKDAVGGQVSDAVKNETFWRLEARAELVGDVRLDNPLPLAHDRDDDYLIALARKHHAALVTLDQRVQEHAPDDVEVIRPSDLLRELDR